MRDRLGYAAWMAGVAQFFVVHAVVESAWARPYSWAAHNISDLGNVTCAVQAEPVSRYVCSPGHALMNGSLLALGALFLAGVVLTGGLWRPGPAAAAAGFALAGLAPADVRPGAHVLGAALAMGVGNAGLLLAAAGLTERLARTWRWVTLALAAIAGAACVLLLLRRYPVLGMGGMERVAAYPLLLWAFALGFAGLTGLSGRLARPGGNSSATPAG